VRRLFLAPAQLSEALQGRVSLWPDQIRYLGAVLRLGEGARLAAFDGQGGSFPATIACSSDGQPAALLVGPREQAAASAGRADLWLAQALAKGDKLELVVQKATELGATRLLPFAAARSVVKLDPDRAASRTARWQTIAQEAARQCGRADVPTVEVPCTLASLLARLLQDPDRKALLLHGDADSTGLAVAAAGADRVILLIGPEGGFAPEEVVAARAAGATPVRLGRLTLRTETAGLAALAVLLHLAGELG
jgi:16S rRNA (uracil1498-N3)-methyltransferase